MPHTAALKAPLPHKARHVHALEDLHHIAADDLKRVNALIIQKMASEVSLIPSLAGHLIHAGGKRIRPLLTLACAKLAGYEGDRHIPLAASVEFIHTATLLHDDVIDESDLRRGNASANAVWGNKASVLVGDFLFSRAFELMVADGSLEVLQILSKAASTIVEGEVLQLVTTNDVSTTEEDYLRVVQAKTAHLFAAACHIGGVMADCETAQKIALETFGRNLGITFQLIDDALDYCGKETELGKTPGDDFREGKITLPVVLAFMQGSAQEQEFWRRTLGALDQTPEDFSLAADYLKRRGVFPQVIEKAKMFSKQACDALLVFPDSPLRRLLLDLADFCVYRLT